jgi:ATP-dependent DNA helicase RecQ
MIVFIDTEVNKNKKIVDVGCVNDKGEYIHSSEPNRLHNFLKSADYFIGHNIVKHDLIYLRRSHIGKIFRPEKSIDTLFLSTLLFPEKPYHALVKDDKLESGSINNPVNDAINAKKLFIDISKEFNRLNTDIKEIYFNLLNDTEGFQGFFRLNKFYRKIKNLTEFIYKVFDKKICANANISKLINNYPIELAYALSLINTNNIESLLPPWVLMNYSYVEDILISLRNTPCYQGCDYCKNHINPIIGLQKYFGYTEFRKFDGVPLQEQTVQSALKNESLIGVFPTAGGKSLAFQLPALIARENTRGLTVVISPLQSLMKDQVDSLEEKSITTAVTINGLLDPIQKADAINRVRDGSASILYIAPESLRSKTIERLLIGRQVVRFVVDEAHCLSTWGHDFRVDYLYIGEFIKNIQNAKLQVTPTPVSCFTATAKPNVIEDIKDYFKAKLNLDMKIFQTRIGRKNLKYKVYDVEDESQKYTYLRNLIEQEYVPTIIYASRRKTVEEIYKRLSDENFNVSYFHGGMETETKVAEQNKFMSGSTIIMVATSAFGMGVDKSDIGCIIHYEISDSLENYIQEAGRAGRDQNINANCYILYNEDDLNKHFELLNNSKLNIKEIQSVWRAIKELTRLRDNVSQSALEIARKAGWDQNIYDLQTKVTTAIAALEDSGYLKRGQNSPRVFANSVLANSVIQANEIMEKSGLFDEIDLANSRRIIQMLISSKYRSKAGNTEAESRVDYISDILGISKKDVIKSINLLRETKILSDDKDLNAHIKQNSKPTSALKILETFIKLLRFLLDKLSCNSIIYNIKSLNEEAILSEVNSNTKILRMAINYFEIVKLMNTSKEGRDNLKISLEKSKNEISSYLDKLTKISEVFLEYLYLKSNEESPEKDDNNVAFSILELRNEYEKNKGLLDPDCSAKDVENCLFFLQKIGALHIEGGFMVIYSPLNIERLIKDNHRQYTKTDYKKLDDFYKGKMQQIHIVGEYATKMIKDYQNALTFVDDYFSCDYNKFIEKYFTGTRRGDIDNNMSPKKFKQLFGQLTQEQLNVILDKEHKRIVVVAGPGSGKTKLLVHKLASIIYTEDIRHEQLLMLTFSRAAATEFKSRLFDLIGTPAHYIDIMTFHSFAFDLLGKVGDLDKTETIIKEATELIINENADAYKITKAVIVIDEAQDMNEDEYNLVLALVEYNENLRIIAVGDDDQNIFEFRGSSAKYFRQIAREENAFYELPINFRSKKNIVEFTNQHAKKITNRLKITPIRSKTQEDGTIKITRHMNNNFIVPVVNEIVNSKLEGTTCIITRTNDQALQITGLLNKNKQPAKLIQSNDDFKLFNLLELNQFYDMLKKIDEIEIIQSNWELVIKEFESKYSNSDNYDISIRVLQSFKKSVGKRAYLSDLKEFLYESNMSDFFPESKLMVSTFHKAKGKEFDNVYIIFDNNYQHLDNEDLRTLYVGLTRTKTNLNIHTNSEIFENINVDRIVRLIDDSTIEIPDRLTLQLGYRDVNLGYFKFVQRNITGLLSGTRLEIEDNLLKYNGKKILQFSKKTQSDITNYLSKGYSLTEALIRHIVYWFNKEHESTILIVLPELTFDYVGINNNNQKPSEIEESQSQDETR